MVSILPALIATNYYKIKMKQKKENFDEFETIVPILSHT